MVKDELNRGELRKMASSWIEEFRSDCQEAESKHEEAKTKREIAIAKGQLRTLSLNNMSNERVQALETAEGLTNEEEEATVPVAIPANWAELGRYRKLVSARKDAGRKDEASKSESVELRTKPTVTFADETVHILESGGCPINKAFRDDKGIYNVLGFLDIKELRVAARITKQVAALCKSGANCIDQNGGSDEESDGNVPVNLWKVFAEARWPEALAHLELYGPTVDSFGYRSFCQYQSA